MDTTAEMETPVLDGLRKKWGWILALGILLLLAGIAGLYMSVALTITSVMFFGAFILVGGIFTFVDAFSEAGWKGKLWQSLIAICYIIVGGLMIMHPAANAVWLTFFLAAMFIAIGVFRIVGGIRLRGIVPGWGWAVFGGLLSVLLGVMIFAQWPVSGLWVIGLFIAIELIIQGITFISLALASKP